MFSPQSAQRATMYTKNTRWGGPCVRKSARPDRGPVEAWRASHAMLWGGGALTRPRPGTARSGDAGDSGDTGAQLTPLCTTACLSRACRAFCSLFSVLRSPGRVSAPPPAGAWGSTPHLSNQLINKFPLCLFVVLRVLRVFLKTFHFCSSPRRSPRRGVLFSVAVEGLALWACTLCSPFSGRRRRPSFRLAKGAGKVVF